MLVLSPRLSDDSCRVERAASRAGVSTLRLSGWRLPAEVVGDPDIDGLYAEPLFADVVAEPLGLALLEAPLDWLVRCPPALRRRSVRAMTLAQARRDVTAPAFVKALDDKSVPPQVYRCGAELPDESLVDGSVPVLVQGVLDIVAEYRLWCLDGVVMTGSRYAVRGRLAEQPLHGPEAQAALTFGAQALAAVGETLPSAAVLDVGVVGDGSWVVVEVNAAWASGLYEADDHRALTVIRASSLRGSELAAKDRGFVRTGAQVEW